MTISIGERLPEATFKTVTEDGPTNLTTDALFAGRKVVMIGMPGAFTRTCDTTHLPGYIESAETIKAEGVDAIAVMCVNDHNVMNAWAQSTGAAGKLLFLADFDASFTKSIGFDVDMSATGLGTRSRRFSMIVEDGVVTALNVETERGVVSETSAAHILELLQEQRPRS